MKRRVKMGLPGVIYKPERIEKIPRCQGEGKIAALIGPSNKKFGIDKIRARRIEYHTDILYHYTAGEGGQLIDAVVDFFLEARLCHDPQRAPINHAYIIDVGDLDGLSRREMIDRYLKAARVVSEINDWIDMEVYIGADRVGTDAVTISEGETYPNAFTYLMNKIDQHLYKMAHGDPTLGYSNPPRLSIAYAAIPEGLSVNDAVKLTDPAAPGDFSYIRSSRVVLYENPKTLTHFAGLVAGTYPWENPGKHVYKFVDEAKLKKRPWLELVQLKESGINADWLYHPRDERRYGPVWPVASSYCKDQAGQRPVDSTIYARYACDYVARQVIEAAGQMVYDVATQDAVNLLKTSAASIIAKAIDQKVLRDGTVDAYVNVDDPNILDVQMWLTPLESIETVEIFTQILAGAEYGRA